MPDIRPAQASDRDTIAEFNIRLAAESEDVRLEPARIAAGVAALLADPAKGRYWLAETGGRVAGQIMVTFEWSDWRCGWFWWIQSVYVAPEFRGRGVYRALFERVKQEAQERGDVRGLRLYVDLDNAAAMRVYDRTGLAPARYQMRELEW